MTKYIKVPNLSLSITHEDQEVDGLSFNAMVSDSDFNYVKVTGGETEIDLWTLRVNGTETTLEAVEVIIAALPNPNADIAELQTLVADLTEIVLQTGGE